MPNQEDKPYQKFETFEGFFQQAEQRPGYWVELAKLEFTEKMLGRMKELDVSKSELAGRMEAKPAFITRLVSGHNNFTLETMVRIARSLNSEFRCHLQPAGTKTMWIDVLQKEPDPIVNIQWNSEKYTTVIHEIPQIPYESLPAAA